MPPAPATATVHGRATVASVAAHSCKSKYLFNRWVNVTTWWIHHPSRRKRRPRSPPLPPTSNTRHDHQTWSIVFDSTKNWFYVRFSNNRQTPPPQLRRSEAVIVGAASLSRPVSRPAAGTLVKPRDWNSTAPAAAIYIIGSESLCVCLCDVKRSKSSHRSRQHLMKEIRCSLYVNPTVLIVPVVRLRSFMALFIAPTWLVFCV